MPELIIIQDGWGSYAVHLSPLEMKLFELLVSEPFRIFPREEIYEKAWGYVPSMDTKMIQVVASNLRRKLRGEGINAVFGRAGGYSLRAHGREQGILPHKLSKSLPAASKVRKRMAAEAENAAV